MGRPRHPNKHIEAAVQAAEDAGCEILGFVRMEVGEGIEKKEEDFAAEVASMAKG